jgi:hypothetical protein
LFSLGLFFATMTREYPDFPQSENSMKSRLEDPEIAGGRSNHQHPATAGRIFPEAPDIAHSQ